MDQRSMSVRAPSDESTQVLDDTDVEQGRRHTHPNLDHRRLSIPKRVSALWHKTIDHKKKAGRQLNERSRIEYTFVLCAGLCLSFNSGYINGCCMSGLIAAPGEVGLKMPVSHVTGSFTNSALALDRHEDSMFDFYVGVIGCFIAGAFLSGLINPKGSPYQLGPEYGPMFLIGSLLLVASSIMAYYGPEDRGLFYFAAAANGLQNGMSSVYTGNLIRTTHLTGTSTDIGLFLGQFVRGNRANAWKLWVLLGLAASFWLGGIVSFYAASGLRNASLTINAAFFLVISFSCFIYLMRTNDITLLQSVAGNWPWQKALLSNLRSKKMQCSPTADGHEEEVSDDALFEELFDEIDTSHRGYINEAELYEGLGTAGVMMRRNVVHDMVPADNGVLSRQEWLDLTHGHRPVRSAPDVSSKEPQS